MQFPQRARSIVYAIVIAIACVDHSVQHASHSLPQRERDPVAIELQMLREAPTDPSGRCQARLKPVMLPVAGRHAAAGT
jgi:hypothetical protein